MALEAADFSRFNIAIDLVGKCFGTCPGCLLTSDERLSNDLYLSVDDISGALTDICSHVKSCGRVALFIGRGDVLGLDKKSLDKVIAIKSAVCLLKEKVGFKDITIEIATSLIGGQSVYRENAKYLIDGFSDIAEWANIRFVIVTNLSIDVEAYNVKIRNFLDYTASIRGGGEGSGDVINLNFSPFNIPSLESMKRMLDEVHSPVNFIWAYNPSQEPCLNEEHLADSKKWINSFFEYMRSSGSDFNILNVGKAALNAEVFSSIKFQESPENTFYFINKRGSLHSGGFSLMGDFDTERLGVNDSIQQIVRKCLMHPACSSCQWMGACVASGAIRFANLNLLSCKGIDDSTCPSCMSDVFSSMDKDACYV